MQADRGYNMIIMILVVGLGNPGKKYQKNRHNVGFRAIDELRSSQHFASARVIDRLAKQKPKDFVLAEPQTFMNKSGQAVKSLIQFYKAKPENLWVVHDDIDLPLGEIKISKNRGSAGHKGVQSIIDALKTKDFNRVRIGICPKTGKSKNVEKFVLQNFTKQEEEILKESIPKTIDLLMSEINKNPKL